MLVPTLRGSVVETVVPLSLMLELMIEFAPLALGTVFVVKEVEVVLPEPEGVWQEPSPRRNVEEEQVPDHRPMTSVEAAAVKALVPLPLAIPVSVPTPMPPRATASVPVQPSVRACVEMEPVTFVSFVTELTVVDGCMAATMEQYPGAALDPVQLPQTLSAFALASVKVTAPVEPLLLAKAPSPENEETPLDDPLPNGFACKAEVMSCTAPVGITVV